MSVIWRPVRCRSKSCVQYPNSLPLGIDPVDIPVVAVNRYIAVAIYCFSDNPECDRLKSEAVPGFIALLVACTLGGGIDSSVGKSGVVNSNPTNSFAASLRPLFVIRIADDGLSRHSCFDSLSFRDWRGDDTSTTVVSRLLRA
jgi:hypothetical protein